MATNKMIGLALVIGGVALAFWGYQISQSAGSQLASAFSDAPPDEVLYRYIGGALLAAAGAVLVAKN